MPGTPLANYAFTKLCVHDLQGMAEYYEKVYGLTPYDRVKAEIDGERIDELMMGLDGVRQGFILLTWVDRQPPQNGEVILGFSTTDIEGLFARAEAAGGTVMTKPAGSVVPNLLVGFVKDPEGHLAEVIQQVGKA